jgi:catechol 2,3-dioxygenase-like lactoylglutathione lyase family enzyme
VIDHVAIQVKDVAASAAFYDAVLAPPGSKRLMEFETVVGFGSDQPRFWLGPVTTEGAPRELHLAFAAPDRATVDAFHAAAVAAGAEVLHEPREWPIYHRGYYGAFVRDLDGNNVEAVCHAPQ